MAPTIERYLIPLVVGLAPVLLFALTWAPDGDLTGTKLAIRSQVVPVTLSEIFVILVALRTGLLSSLRDLRPPKRVLAAGAILLLVMIGTAVAAPAPLTARLRTAYWIIHLLFGFSVMHLSGKAFEAQGMIRAYFAGFAMFVALLVTFVLAVSDPARFDWTAGLPAAGHIRHYGYYAAAIVGLCAGTMAIAERRADRVPAAILAAVAFGFALWTGSRGAVAAAVAAIALGLVLVPALRSARAWGGAAASLAASVLIVYWLPVPAENMGIARTVEATSGGNIATGRTELWRLVFEAILERPLFGHGEGQMATVAPFYTMVHPHNVVLQTLLAWGIVGSVCILVLATAFAIFAVRRVRASGGWLVPPFLAMTTLVLFSAFDGTLYHALPLSIFAACAGLIAAGQAGNRAEAA